MALAACLHGNYSCNGLRQTPDEPSAARGQPTQHCSHHKVCVEKGSSKNVGYFGSVASSGHELLSKQAERR